METTHARAGLSREPRLSGWETTEKKSDTQTIDRNDPDTTLRRSHGASSISFQGHHILKGRSIQRYFETLLHK